MVFSGKLCEFDLIDFIKFVSAMKKSAVLVIQGSMPAKIYFANGDIKSVVVPNNFVVIHKQYLASILEGDFALEDLSLHNDINFIEINEDTNVYLLDLARLRENPPDVNLYTPEMTFELKPTYDIGKLEFTDLDWKVIALLTEQKKLSDLVERLDVNIEKLQWVVYSLEQAGLIQRKRPKEENKVKEHSSSIISQLRSFLTRIKPKW